MGAPGAVAQAERARLQEMAATKVAEHRKVATEGAKLTVQQLLRTARRRRKPPRT